MNRDELMAMVYMVVGGASTLFALSIASMYGAWYLGLLVPAFIIGWKHEKGKELEKSSKELEENRKSTKES